MASAQLSPGLTPGAPLRAVWFLQLRKAKGLNSGLPSISPAGSHFHCVVAACRVAVKGSLQGSPFPESSSRGRAQACPTPATSCGWRWTGKCHCVSDASLPCLSSFMVHGGGGGDNRISISSSCPEQSPVYSALLSSQVLEPVVLWYLCAGGSCVT